MIFEFALVHACGAIVTKQNFKEHGKSILIAFRAAMWVVLLNAVFHAKDLYRTAVDANTFTQTEIMLNGGICMAFIIFAM